VFFAGTLGPVVLITTVTWPGFGRYLYLPLAGLSVGVVDLAVNGLRRLGVFDSDRLRVVLGVAVVAYLGLSAFLLRGFVRDFESDGTLYGAVIETDPTAPHGYGYLGMSLVNIQQPEASLEYLEKALSMRPNEEKYRVSLAQALIDLDRSEEAAALLGRWASEGSPAAAPMYLHRMSYALQETDPPRAVDALLACLRINSAWGSCLDRLAVLSRDDALGPACRAALSRQLQNRTNAAIAPTVRAAVLLDAAE
jgi:tetratricopeptide (TPR) repeat protein